MVSTNNGSGARADRRRQEATGAAGVATLAQARPLPSLCITCNTYLRSCCGSCSCAPCSPERCDFAHGLEVALDAHEERCCSNCDEALAPSDLYMCRLCKARSS